MNKKMFLFSILAAAILFPQISIIAQNNTFLLPVTSYASGYRMYNSQALVGQFHTGDDYYNSNLKVFAGNCGVVVKKYLVGKRNPDGYTDRGLGNTLIIKHNMADGGTAYTLYGHLDSFASGTEEGKYVSRGQRIGTIGKTGTGAGIYPHLHYEIKRSGILGNPLAFGTYGVNALNLVGYVPKWAGNRWASSATDYGYWNPSDRNYSAICR